MPAAPVLLGVAGRAIGNTWIITGQVSDEDAGHAQVAVSGDVAGAANVHADGSFDFIATHSGSGTAAVLATDTEGLHSPSTPVCIPPPVGNQAPYLTLSVSYGPGKSITLTGRVYDENPAGRVVTFSGAASGAAVANWSGNYVVMLAATSLGSVFGQVTDGQGLASNLAFVTLTSNKPQIVDFSLTVREDNSCVIKGRVLDEWPAGLTVDIGGTMPGVAGQHATVMADGTFQLIVVLPVDHSLWGSISATVTDWWGLTSDPVCGWPT